MIGTTAAISAPVLWLRAAKTTEARKKNKVLVAVLIRSCKREKESVINILYSVNIYHVTYSMHFKVCIIVCVVCGNETHHLKLTADLFKFTRRICHVHI